MVDAVEHLLQKLVEFFDESTGALDAVVIVVQTGDSPSAAI